MHGLVLALAWCTGQPELQSEALLSTDRCHFTLEYNLVQQVPRSKVGLIVAIGCNSARIQLPEIQGSRYLLLATNHLPEELLMFTALATVAQPEQHKTQDRDQDVTPED